MTVFEYIQQAILREIDKPSFNGSFPPLSDRSWMRILGPPSQVAAENDRLEYLGDALMYATLGIQVYKQLPDGGPGLYTSIRSALHSNKTFSRLAEKLDILAVGDKVLKALTSKTFGEGVNAPYKSKPQIKATADLFETVIGLYYLDHGFEALCKWVDELYQPLVSVSANEYLRWRGPGKHRNSGKSYGQVYPPMSTLRMYPSGPSRYSPLKPMRSYAQRPSRYSPYRPREIPVTPRKVFQPKPSPMHRRTIAPPSTSALALKLKGSPVVIDLTMDEDSDPVKVAAESPSKAPLARCSPIPFLLSKTEPHPPADAQTTEANSVAVDSAEDAADELELECMLLASDDTEASGSPMDLAGTSDLAFGSGSSMDLGTPDNSSSETESDGGQAVDEEDVPLLLVFG